jgi:hypothetical protein
MTPLVTCFSCTSFLRKWVHAFKQCDMWFHDNELTFCELLESSASCSTREREDASITRTCVNLNKHEFLFFRMASSWCNQLST